ncbi:mycothiol transferase [Streptomyces sp. NPDC054952]
MPRSDARTWLTALPGTDPSLLDDDGLHLRIVPPSNGRIDGKFTEFHVEDADVAEAFAFWREACEGSRAAADAVESLEDTVDFRGEIISLRYVLTHMIEEYARHNGHADLLREAIDGEVGE